MGTDDIRSMVRRAIDAHGVEATRTALKLSAEATCRLGGGLPVQRGTMAQAAANAPRLADLDNKGPHAA
ncbi:MAG: hypothetical protein NVS3B10_30440 [Polyangiales bacterium]